MLRRCSARALRGGSRRRRRPPLDRVPRHRVEEVQMSVIDGELQGVAEHDGPVPVDRRAEARSAVVREQGRVVIGRGLDRRARGFGLYARRIDREEDVRDTTKLLDEVGSYADTGL